MNRPSAEMTKPAGRKTMKEIRWATELEPLFAAHRNRKHPLNYQSRWQLVVMTILSAQSSDVQINKVAPPFFEKFPDAASLLGKTREDLFPFINKVRNFGNKAKWILAIAETIREDAKIPTTMAELTKLPGIGRKSASVIIRDSGGKAEGIIIDLHVLRVVPRLGISAADNPDRMEKDLMALIPEASWNDAGMGFSFLGRDLCRPTDPKCPECMMVRVCAYANSPQGTSAKKASAPSGASDTGAKKAKPAERKPKTGAKNTKPAERKTKSPPKKAKPAAKKGKPPAKKASRIPNGRRPKKTRGSS